MSLISIVQAVMQRTLGYEPSSVINNTDQIVTQLHGYVNEAGKDLVIRHDWERLKSEFTHTTTAAEDQGNVTTVIGADFAYIVNDTFWNRSTDRRITGPLTPQDWQREKASSIVTVDPRYRIRGGKLLIAPTPSAGDTIAGEFVSKNWVSNAAGDTFSDSMTADTDLSLIDEELVTLSAHWRILQAKSLDYSEPFRKYELRLATYTGRDGGKGALSMSPRPRNKVPGAVFPDGDWLQ